MVRHPLSGAPAPLASLEGLVRRAVLGADQPALSDDHQLVTHGELERATRCRAAALLAGGLAPGDRVALALPNGVDAALALLAVIRAGLVWVGLSPSLPAAARRRIVEHADVALVVDDPAQLAGGADDRPLPPHDPRALAAISYTSGSTGSPKGVMHSQHNLAVAALAAARTGRGGTRGMYLPMSSVNMQILGPLAAVAGRHCCVITDDRGADAVAAWVRRRAVGSLPLARPTVVDWVADASMPAATLDSLRAPVVGGGAVPDDLLAAYERRFGHRLTAGYGLTEGPTSVCREPLDRPHRPGSSGVALEHLDVEVLDPSGVVLSPGEIGEICVGARRVGPHTGEYRTMLGYWRDPARSEQALAGGRLHTGDLGRLDPDGFLTVLGRLDDVIVRGGSNVSPAEIEAVVRTVDGVTDVAVLGRADPRFGQVPVVLYTGRAQPGDVAARCRQQLAAHQQPAACVAVAAIPRPAPGKLDRRAAAALVERLSAAD